MSVIDEAADFPTAEQRGVLAHALGRAVPLDEESLDVLRAATNGSVEALMIRLLPVAARYAVTPLSGFPVGAVLEGRGRDGWAAYFGANMEFRGHSPATSIHAEQAALLNAWMHGATRLRRLAVSSPPCGYCRQFLNEWRAPEEITVLVESSGSVVTWPLGELLPEAFGPRHLGVDLDVDRRLGDPAAAEPVLVMDGHGNVQGQEEGEGEGDADARGQADRRRAGAGSGRKAEERDADARGEADLDGGGEDEIVRMALSAAGRSHAPYTGNLAGVCLETAAGRTFQGRAIENAAFGPSLSAMHVALAFMHLNLPPGASRRIQRAVMVERPTAASQRALAAAVLKSRAPEATFEYHAAELRSRPGTSP